MPQKVNLVWCIMNDNSITLWFGNRGTKLDEFNNVYSVSKNVLTDKEWAKPDLVSFYQSILMEIGLSVEIDEYEVFDPITGAAKMRTVHKISGIPKPLPLHKAIGYEYIKD